MAKHGCTIIGDARYGDPIDRKASCTLLHAHRLVLPNGQSFEADILPDINRYLETDIQP